MAGVGLFLGAIYLLFLIALGVGAFFIDWGLGVAYAVCVIAYHVWAYKMDKNPLDD